MILAAVAALASQAQPVTVATIDPRHRLIEGVATDGRTIWVSSLLDRHDPCVPQAAASRCRCCPKGFTRSALPGTAAASGCGSRRTARRASRDRQDCDRGALLAIDAKGKARPASNSAGRQSAHPGDVSASGGQVFVSDSQNGAVYRLLPSGKALMALVLPGAGKSGQGSVLDSSAAKRSSSSDYSQGITTIDLATGKRTVPPRLADKPLLRGIDGLARCGEPLFRHLQRLRAGADFRAARSARRASIMPTWSRACGCPIRPSSTFDGKRLLVVGNSRLGGRREGRSAYRRRADRRHSARSRTANRDNRVLLRFILTFPRLARSSPAS